MLKPRVVNVNPKDVPAIRRQRWFEVNTHNATNYGHVGYALQTRIYANTTVPRGHVHGDTRPQPLTQAQRALLERGVDDEALAHYKSIALRQCVNLGYAIRTRPGGFYRTTPAGCHAIQTFPDAYAKLLSGVDL